MSGSKLTFPFLVPPGRNLNGRSFPAQQEEIQLAFERLLMQSIGYFMVPTLL